MTEKELYKLFDLIGEELDAEQGLPADYYNWERCRITDEQFKHRLLGLCKLLNRLFFDHAPLET